MLGTYIEVSIYADADDAMLIDISNNVFAKINKIESIMSFYNINSELSYLNQEAHKKPCLISYEMNEVLSLALKLSQLTNGIFDVSIASQLIKRGLLPNNFDYDESASWRDIYLEDGNVFFNKKMVIELGGIAKGYAVDYAYSAVKDKVDDIIINAGGDIRRKKWQNKNIEIKASDSKGNKQLINTVMLNEAMATSASYYIDKAKAAIFSPNTKKPINDKRSISVFAHNCMLADALTKVAFLSDDTSITSALGAKIITLSDDKKIINY